MQQNEIQMEMDPRDEQINELIKANTDFDNLLRSAEIGVLYLDSDGTIRKISPIMAKYTKLLLADTGRKIDEVLFLEGYPDFPNDIKETLHKQQTVEREVLINGKLWLLRICPYFLYTGISSGVIVILFDITKRLEAVKYELRLLMNNIPGGVCKLKYDNGLILQYANEGMFSLMKTTPGEFAATYGNHYEKLLYPDDWSALQEKIAESIKTGETLHMEYTVHYVARKEEWRLMQASVLTCDGSPVLQCVVTDITGVKRTYTELEQTYKALESERAKLNVIVEMSADMLFEYDIEKDSMDYTRQGEGILNEKQINKDYVQTIKKLGYFHSEDAEILRQFCEELQMGKSHIYVEIRKRYKDGRYHWIEIEGKTIYDETGKPVKVIGRTNNIDDRKAKEEHFRICSETDSLTGLYNHQVIIDKIKGRLKKLTKEQSGWLIIFDVDNFKLVNDRNGHLVGDAVLCMFADELKGSFKKGLLGRIGGDEFIAYVDEMPRDTLETILSNINSTMQDVYKDEEKNLQVSCSAGVVRCDSRTKEFDKLFEWADYALYKVKQESKNGFYVVEGQGQEKAPEIGYLTREVEEEYIRDEAVIKTSEELVMFAFELLESVSDVQSGLKMVSDRICSFFDIDDVAYIVNMDGMQEKKYHWSRKKKRQTNVDMLHESKAAWEYIWNHFNDKGVLVLRKEAISHMPGEQVGSILFVHPDKSDSRECIAFVDRTVDRDWEAEKDSLIKLAGVLFNRLQQMYDTEKERNEIEFQMNYDPLTRLPQYHKFFRLAEQYRREQGSKNLYFIYSDFANFQYMNELYGYTEGDKILQEFAKQLQTLPGGIFFSRINSDHFVALVKGTDENTVQEEYLALTKAFCDRINAGYDQSNLLLVSGISGVQSEAESNSSVIDRANIARKYGKNTANTVAVLYNQEIKRRNEAEKSVTANMVSALENGEFKAWLQPKVSLDTGKIIGAEALVRWQRADDSMVYPDQFIPVFEKNGFITKVDFAVLEQVLSYLREAMDLDEQVVPVSVNFSRRHNENQEFVEEILKQMRERDIPAKYLEAEITESVFMLDLSTLTGNLRKLKEHGITISIDDFGSGYSSLNVLANVEADVIKLDKKFLSDTSEDSKAPVFIKYLIKMMKRMGYKVIAEGVETKEQLAFLHNAECDMVQGYYYARPMPIAEFREFLKEFNK